MTPIILDPVSILKTTYPKKDITIFLIFKDKHTSSLSKMVGFNPIHDKLDALLARAAGDKDALERDKATRKEEERRVTRNWQGERTNANYSDDDLEEYGQSGPLPSDLSGHRMRLGGGVGGAFAAARAMTGMLPHAHTGAVSSPYHHIKRSGRRMQRPRSWSPVSRLPQQFGRLAMQSPGGFATRQKIPSRGRGSRDRSGESSPESDGESETETESGSGSGSGSDESMSYFLDVSYPNKLSFYLSGGGMRSPSLVRRPSRPRRRTRPEPPSRPERRCTGERSRLPLPSLARRSSSGRENARAERPHPDWRSTAEIVQPETFPLDLRPSTRGSTTQPQSKAESSTRSIGGGEISNQAPSKVRSFVSRLSLRKSKTEPASPNVTVLKTELLSTSRLKQQTEVAEIGDMGRTFVDGLVAPSNVRTSTRLLHSASVATRPGNRTEMNRGLGNMDRTYLEGMGAGARNRK